MNNPILINRHSGTKNRANTAGTARDVVDLEGGGKALLFENPEGSSMPLLINAFGSWRRIQIGLGVSNLDDIAKEIEQKIVRMDMKRFKERDIAKELDIPIGTVASHKKRARNKMKNYLYY